MVRTRRWGGPRGAVRVAAAGAVVALASWGAAASAATKSLEVTTLSTAKFGTILASGHTVYTLDPSSTPCKSTCLSYWPEVLLPKGQTKAVAGSGVDAAKLGTRKVSGGRLQVTYGGKALYWFSLDKADGQVKGNVRDTWGKWSVVVVSAKSGGTTTTTTKGSSGGTTTTTTKSSGGGTTTTTSGGGNGGVGF